MASELAYKKAFRASVGWSSAIEPGRGGDTGAADLLVLVGQRIVPIELKLGHMHADGRVTFHSPGIRPAQIVWHHALAKAGGFSLLAAGEFLDGAWTSYLFWGEHLTEWRGGLVPIADTSRVMLPDLLPQLVRQFGT